jgi:hypothetical protein
MGKQNQFEPFLIPFFLTQVLAAHLALYTCENLAADTDLSVSISSPGGASLSGGNQASAGLTAIRPQDTHYTVKVGDTLTIPCVIEHRKHATVIWQYSKNKIPETLTIGYFYYRKDYRIRVIANTSVEAEQSWNLEIRKVKLEDEGYYLCKVMAEPESLKRVVFLRVEVDLRMHSVNHHHQQNQPVALDHNVVLICNTSYALKEPKTANHSHHHMNHMRIMWFKDNEPILINDQHHHHHHHQHDAAASVSSSTVIPNESRASAAQSSAQSSGELKHIHVVNNNSVLNYKIEYNNKPVLWSKLVIRSLQPANLGMYTCMFRNQSVSLLVSLETGELIYLFLKTQTLVLAWQSVGQTRSGCFLSFKVFYNYFVWIYDFDSN